MKLEFLWDDTKTSRLHRLFLILISVNSLTALLFGIFLPEPDSLRKLTIISIPIFTLLYACISLLFLKWGNQGFKFLYSALLIQICIVLFMGLTGGFVSIAQFAPYTAMLITVFALGAGSTLILGAFSVLTFISLFLALSFSNNNFNLTLNFLFYISIYIAVTFILSHIGKEISVQFEAKKKLEQVDDLKNQFIALSSHYLRTPITVIRGYLDRLAETNLSAKQSEFIYAIKQSSDQLESLTGKLLVISTIERGNANLKLSADNLNVFLSHIVEGMKTFALDKKVTLQFQAAGFPVELAFDKNRLQTAITYLIDNSIKYNKEHGTVSVALNTFDQKAIITITDTGMGIKPDELENLFSPFNKGSMENVLNLNNGGAGLSLYLVKLIVDAHKGKIKITSTPNQGTEVTISLPIEKNS